MGVLYDFNKYEALNVGRYKVDFIEKWRRGSLVSEICPYHRMNFQGLCNPTPILITEAPQRSFLDAVYGQFFPFRRLSEPLE